jgi:hypothetical protein
MSRSQRYHAHRALLVAACALAVLLIGVMHWSREPSAVDTTQGTIRDTRVVPYYALETKWGSQLIWTAEYQVVYSAGGREYAVWATSGVRAESKPDVLLRLPQPRPTCRVRYNLKEPESAVAHCP